MEEMSPGYAIRAGRNLPDGLIRLNRPSERVVAPVVAPDGFSRGRVVCGHLVRHEEVSNVDHVDQPRQSAPVHLVEDL